MKKLLSLLSICLFSLLLCTRCYAGDDIWDALSWHFSLNRYNAQLAVRQKIEWFASNPYDVYLLTKNAQPFIYYVFEQAKAHQLPAEVALIPMIESNYNPFLYSNRGVTGLWAMMPGTASGFGLKINWWYDGRRDITTSTDVAMNYLNYLHHFFKSWLLAIAAYDSGEGTVQNAIRYNKKHHRPTDFWALPLPQETKNYVPKLLALAEIIHHHRFYGINLYHVPDEPYFDSVNLSQQVELSQAARLAHISETNLRLLNPAFRRWATEPGKHYQLLLPISKIDTFNYNLAHHHIPLVRWQHHWVASGETLSTIAAQYNVSAKTIKEANLLPSSSIKLHQSLLIPMTQKAAHHHPFIRTNNVNEAQLPGPQLIWHTSVKNDSLLKIAYAYHITVNQLVSWNQLSSRAVLTPGQRLLIWKPAHRYLQYHTIKHWHTVLPGENLSILAKRFHTSVEHLTQLNNLTHTMLHPKQKLLVSQSQTHHLHQGASVIIHHAHAGDTIHSLAKYYRVSPINLRAWNHLSPKAKLHAAQHLIVRVPHEA